jgi:tetratricopeptide (TPR) repeat protein
MNYQVSPESKSSGLFGRTNRIKITMTAMLMVLLSSFTFAQSPEVRKAFRLIDIEQPTKGIAALEQLAQSNAGNQYYLGLGYIRTGAVDKALATFEKAISANEKDAMSHAGKGQVKLIQKNPSEAKVSIDKALALSKSKDVNVLRAVGEAYLADTKYLLDAINVLTKAKGMNGGDPEIHMLLGDAYLMQNNGGESVSSYERAAKADPKLAKAPYKVGKVYERSKNMEIATESFNKAISIDPEFAPAYKELGETYYQQKEAQKAVDAYGKYLAITENPGNAKFQYAFFLFMAKSYDKANDIFKEVTTNPNVPATAFKFYSLSLDQQNKNDEARSMFEKYLQKAKPEEIQASDYAFYGKLLLKMNEDSLANEAFVSSLALDSLQPEILQLQGDSYFKRKKYADAVDAFRKLISIRKAPLSQDLWSIGRAYYYNEQFAEADSAFTQLAEKQPNMTVGYLWAARSRSNLDPELKSGIAKPMYDTLLEKALQNPEKNKKDIIEAYEYLGAYFIYVKQDVPQSKQYFQKILEIDPKNQKALDFIKEVNKPAPSANKAGTSQKKD